MYSYIRLHLLEQTYIRVWEIEEEINLELV